MVSCHSRFRSTYGSRLIALLEIKTYTEGLHGSRELLREVLKLNRQVGTLRHPTGIRSRTSLPLTCGLSALGLALTLIRLHSQAGLNTFRFSGLSAQLNMPGQGRFEGGDGDRDGDGGVRLRFMGE